METLNQASMIELVKTKKEMGGLCSSDEVGFPKTKSQRQGPHGFY